MVAPSRRRRPPLPCSVVRELAIKSDPLFQLDHGQGRRGSKTFRHFDISRSRVLQIPSLLNTLRPSRPPRAAAGPPLGAASERPFLRLCNVADHKSLVTVTSPEKKYFAHPTQCGALFALWKQVRSMVPESCLQELLQVEARMLTLLLGR